ncbi:MAG TPA: radical SAM protein, partial [Euryarchaeota archaeon]|nr:radical SAM protein [Euryarchaeota archaeon]
MMLIRDLNDDEESLLAIRDILDLDRINPSRIYFNAPIRPPSEPWVKVPSQESIERALDMFPGS